MKENIFFSSVWFGIIALVVLETSDLLITVYTFHKARKTRIFFQEANAFYAAHVGEWRKIVVRRCVSLFALKLSLVFVFNYINFLYAFYVGIFILENITTHLKHFENLCTFRFSSFRNIEQEKFHTAFGFFMFSLLFVSLALFEKSQFLLGGAFGTLTTAISIFSGRKS